MSNGRKFAKDEVHDEILSHLASVCLLLGKRIIFDYVYHDENGRMCASKMYDKKHYLYYPFVADNFKEYVRFIDMGFCISAQVSCIKKDLLEPNKTHEFYPTLSDLSLKIEFENLKDAVEYIVEKIVEKISKDKQ